jgi:hypothetical protein
MINEGEFMRDHGAAGGKQMAVVQSWHISSTQIYEVWTREILLCF